MAEVDGMKTKHRPSDTNHRQSDVVAALLNDNGFTWNGHVDHMCDA